MLERGAIQVTTPSGFWGLLRHRLGHAPGLLSLRRHAYARRFAREENCNLYSGIFESFEDAARSAPQTKPVGYDNDASARMYGDATAPTMRDYPAMFWLQHVLHAHATTILDLGGHVGIKYFAFRDRLRLAPAVSWTVCDVPAVVARGTEILRTRSDAAQLRFTSDWRELVRSDVVFASGSLQYLELPFSTMLASSTPRPRFVIINTAALHPTRSFYTLNSIGSAFCPYRVQAEGELVASLEALGYRQLDRWQAPRTFRIPFEPAYDMDYFVGMAFERSTR